MAKKESYMGKKQVESLSYEQLKNMNTSQLRAVARTYRKMLNERNKAKEKAGIAVRETEKSVAASPKDTKNDILRKIVQMRTPFRTTTSTTRGWKKTTVKGFKKALKGGIGDTATIKWNNRTKSLTLSYNGNGVTFSSDEVNDFWSKFHETRDMALLKRGSQGSAEILKVVIDEYIMLGSLSDDRIEQISKEFYDRYQDNEEDEDDLPF